jgi:hypothetical protein
MVVKPKSTIGAKGAIQTMLMKYAAIVTYTDGSKTGATIEAQSAAKAWNKILNLFNPETISGIEVAAILAEERECKA